ncbi:MAG: YggS family pyridoxal phosphate-dependent enzyme [Acidimicrobiia bacterium]|nr:YggS family pyridoxal phosphate-dependent enzyme [Acidimicrobiia bacterium]
MSIDVVLARVAAACERAGRTPAEVTVVGVTKYADVDGARALVAAGVVDLGENHAQQLRDRVAEVPGARWHFIGPLQRNKAKHVAALAVAFHALDRVEVAAALDDRRPPGEALDCYIQVNLAGEATKAGVAEAEVAPLLAACASLDGIRVVGLMAMPPLASSPEDSRPWFRTLAALAQDHGLAGLSMGTTADFEVAIEEGATAVRVGSAFFAR